MRRVIARGARSAIARLRPLFVLAVLASLLSTIQPSDLGAQTARQLRREPLPQKPQVTMNAWTVGLAGGLLEGAPIRLAAEMARVVDDGEKLHVLPVVTRGPTENVNSLLYLRGIDAAIINSDSLDEYKSQVPDIQQRLAYILNLFPSELHIFVRPEIQNLSDLTGKKVNFNTLGTAAAYSGPLIFSRLGLSVDQTFIPHQIALEQMRKGEIAAVVFITSKPVDVFVRGHWEPGFKFLPVPYSSKFEDYYLPATLDAAEYPNLIKQGERIDTIAVPTALVAFNFPAGSNRFERLERFVDYLFSRIEKLQQPGFDPKWKTINLAATVPGLARFPAAQAWLDKEPRAARPTQ
ncbi:C4-dicarboxylate ABC transporter substrate-binding protein [Bradyrhizobium jicamae]|uniref:C4-dicarboxylate ABC transporter substrate-binding protein n=1 Tax=Bradyrhizobium jicamae TaxID=280332 RepID=A0ABS5FJZ7_9BRAD|nr:TAXI family TRAP transporter solute-binding subunit [Bradyrhizobium jicamae]MBR0797114.1 C4-dicarboxylate ABC transporter substrate-binding protein [Bradyrhizobium jicamae]MBR0937628.1 C4-dicarboxylate ABC transporter substrate-binding protein [Bradyrhizobium jicamae]